MNDSWYFFYERYPVSYMYVYVIILFDILRFHLTFLYIKFILDKESAKMYSIVF